MHFECDRHELMEALSNVSRAAAPKSTFNIIEGIFMRATKRGLYLCCYNLDMGITKNIGADVIRAGEIVMPIKICDIVRRLPGDRVVVECDEKMRVHIKSELSEFDIIGMPTTEFPELPVVDSEHSVNIPQGKLRTMISQTAFAISTRQDKPVYTGALFEVEEEGSMRTVTLDGFRVAVRIEPIEGQGQFEFIVPGKTIGEISKMLDDNDDNVEINVARHNIIFLIDGYSIISRLMSGKFINYRSAFASKDGNVVTVKTSALVAAIERISLVITESQKSPVCCIFGHGRIRFTCETAVGKAEDEIACDCDCDDIIIGFNTRYMLDAFRAVDTDELKMLIVNGKTPVQVLPPEGEHFLYLLMPVMLNINPEAV